MMLTDYRVRQREYLLEITRALTGQLNLDAVLSMVLEASTTILAGQAGLIALRTEDNGFAIRASFGLPRTLLPYFGPLLTDIPDDADRRRFIIPGLSDKLGQIVAGLSLNLQQVVALPMSIGNELIGVLYVFRAYGTRFNANDRQVLSSFADQAAIAVHNAQLYERVVAEKRRLDAILEYSADGVMILDAALKVTVFNRALSAITGWSASEALGQNHDAIIRWKELTTAMDLSQALLGGWPTVGAGSLYVEGDLLRRQGGTISVGITYAPLVDREKRLLNIIANVRDITRFREAEELKSTFVSVVSHELKTPVAIIKGYAGTLRRKDARWDQETVQESLSVIEEEADRLNQLINNLLDASRLQAGSLPLEEDDVDLPFLARRVVERFQHHSPEHRFAIGFPPDFPIVRGDPTRLEQVLDNLVSNAIKFSPPKTEIEISGRVRPDRVEVRLHDCGSGVPAADQPHVFERFYRGGDERNRPQGTGLGLYLSRALIEAHGGRIWLESVPDEGTTVTFTLPLAQRPGDRELFS